MAYNTRDAFMTELKALGGKVSNRVLFTGITQVHGDDPWTADYYMNVRTALIDEGIIKLGRGRGGTVMVNDYRPLEDISINEDGNPGFIDGGSSI